MFRKYMVIGAHSDRPRAVFATEAEEVIFLFNLERINFLDRGRGVFILTDAEEFWYKKKYCMQDTFARATHSA